jgi:hypothetical protein
MAATEVSKEAMETVAEKAPITAERKVRGDLETKLPKPCNVLFFFPFPFFFFFFFLFFLIHICILLLESIFFFYSFISIGKIRTEIKCRR